MKFGLTEEIYNSLKRIMENYQQYNFKILGSRARGNYKKTSDIDIAIFKNVKKEDEYSIRNEIDKLNIIYKIDLVFVTDKTKKELLKSIKEEGVEF